MGVSIRFKEAEHGQALVVLPLDCDFFYPFFLWSIRSATSAGFFQDGFDYIAQEGKGWQPFHSRSEVCRRLGTMDAPEALAAVIELAEDPDKMVQAAAVQSLGERGDPRAIPVLTKALASTDPVLPFHAMSALSFPLVVLTLCVPL